MKIPNWFKIIWWFLIVGFFTFLLSQRYDSIMNGTTTSSDVVIFIIFIALIVVPLFQEFSFFGISYKKAIDNLKSEVKEQIFNLRTEIQNSINMKTEFNQQIQFTPSSESELTSLEERIKPVLDQALSEKGIQKIQSIEEPIVPDDTRFLFSIRYAIESELKRISTRLWSLREQPARQIAINLSKRNIIYPDIVDIIHEIFAICSSAIHGEDVSDASVKFVRDAAPPLLTYLKNIEEQPPEWINILKPQPWISKE